MAKLITTFKLVLLSIIFLVGVTYLTVEPPQKIERKKIELKNLPQSVELISNETLKFATKSIVKKGTVIFVGNHESIAIANDLRKELSLKSGQFVIVSNVSDAPWFIKRWQAHTKNQELNKEQNNIPWIYDRDGAMRNFLQVPTSDAIKFFVYNVKEDESIEKIFTGRVKIGTLDGKVEKSEQERFIKSVAQEIKKKIK